MIKERESKFELLRIIAMLMIVGSHLASHGIMHCLDSIDPYVLWSEGNIINRLFSTVLSMGGKVGAGLFFIITGYFMINNNNIRLSRVVLETIYYAGVAAVILIVSLALGYRYPELSTSKLIEGAVRDVVVPVSGGGGGL